MLWIRRYKQKSLFPKFQLIPILHFQVMHDYVYFIDPIDYCVEKVLCPRLFFENCSHFILKWFQPNSFGEMCFLEECTTNIKKIHILKFWECPLFDIGEYAFKLVGIVHKFITIIHFHLLLLHFTFFCNVKYVLFYYWWILFWTQDNLKIIFVSI